MQIAEIFQSMDGEVNSFGQGTLATFVRLAGCNFQCSYCFGIRPGRRVPRIVLSKKGNKKLNEIRAGDKLLTFDDHNQELVETVVDKVIIREVDKWLRIKINGRQYFVTEEHPFFTAEGLKEAKDLTTEDYILHSCYQDKLSFRMRGNRNLIYNEEIKARKISNTDYKSVGKKISEAIKYKKTKGIYVSSYEKLSSECREKIRLRASERMKGNKNSNWKGGVNLNYNKLKEKVKLKEIIYCSVCGLMKELDIHHKDGDNKNDALSNLEVLCESCHYSGHQMGYNFWRGPRKDGKTSSAKNGFKVQEIKSYDREKFSPSIKPKTLRVYNLSCSPYNSYLVDYFWVHNCDTPQGHLPGSFMDVEQVFQKVKKLKCPKVTITGGEPLFQGDETLKLVDLLLKALFKISVESNGSFAVPLFYLRKKNLCWVFDYKLEFDASMQWGTMCSLSSWHWIKFVIQAEQDYRWAIEIIEALRNKGCQARIAFSPCIIEGQKMVDPVALIQWLIDDKLWFVVVNIQIHKLISVK